MKVMILAGGGGTRLYPLSTPDRPKQFLSLGGEEPLIAATVGRFRGIVGDEDIIVITGERYRAETERVLAGRGMNVHIVAEPAPRNTAPAIMLGVRYALDVLGCGEDERIFVAPSDHAIKPLDAYLDDVMTAANYAGEGYIVTLGIKPTSPATGYGYIRAAKKGEKCTPAAGFKEKPDERTAREYLASGEYYWNAGMFAFTPRTFQEELRAADEELYKAYMLGYESLYAHFGEVKKISIDYAVAERSSRVYLVVSSIDWSDLGSWDAYYDFCAKDEHGNVTVGDVTARDCEGCLIYSESDHLGVANLKNLIVISARGGTVVLPRLSPTPVTEISKKR